MNHNRRTKCNITTSPDPIPPPLTPRPLRSIVYSMSFMSSEETYVDTCNVQGVEGIADSSFRYCCPVGCGQCGGSGCGSISMYYVMPGDTPGTLAASVKEGETSADYCCTSAFFTPPGIKGECGVGTGNILPPCVIPAGVTCFVTKKKSVVSLSPCVLFTPPIDRESTAVV